MDDEAICEQAHSLPWHEVAASAYRAYSNSVGNKTFQGNPLPAWESLP